MELKRVKLGIIMTYSIFIKRHLIMGMIAVNFEICLILVGNDATKNFKYDILGGPDVILV